MYKFLDAIPDGWKLYTADCSISDKCSVTLIRCDQDRRKWNALSDEQSDSIKLYASGSGKDFKAAFEKAVSETTPFGNDFSIDGREG